MTNDVDISINRSSKIKKTPNEFKTV